MKKILCFGDSNTWGYIPVDGYSCPIPTARYPKNVRWTGILSENPQWEVIEEGLSGRTSCFPNHANPCLTGSSYFEACLLTHEPLDVVVVMLGTNDMSETVCNDMFACSRGLSGMIRRGMQSLVISSDAKVLLVSPILIKPKSHEIWSTFSDKSVENSHLFAKFFREQAEVNGWDFLDAAEFAEPGDRDGIHLDEQGHRALAEAIAKKLNEMLG